jgi:hypothetical protein
MGDEHDKLVLTDHYIASIKADIEASTPSRRRRIFDAIALAALGGLLSNRKLNANYFKSDGQIWHVPGFCGLSHRCPEVR